MNRRIYLSPPHMGTTEMKYIQEAFDTNWIAPLGANVDAFESELSGYTGLGHILALSSGTAGIHLAIRYLGVKPGDDVFCSSLTFLGSCNPILYQYANPVFIDSEPESWNMSPCALQRAFEWAERENRIPRAVIITDLYGQSADYERLLPICRDYGVPVVEDAAEALGASYRGRMCGSFGEIGVFSFNGNKIITTSGGGAVASENAEAVRKMRFWSMQSREPARYYEHKEIGFNYRMSNICAGIGRGQLQVIEERIASKRRIFERYTAGLAGLPIRMMPVSGKGVPNYWLSVLLLDEGLPVSPGDLVEMLEKENIEARHVWKPMHLQPVFRDCTFFAHEDGWDVSRQVFRRGICLPSGTAMSEEEQDKVIEKIRSVMV